MAKNISTLAIYSAEFDPTSYRIIKHIYTPPPKVPFPSFSFLMGHNFPKLPGPSLSNPITAKHVSYVQHVKRARYGTTLRGPENDGAVELKL